MLAVHRLLETELVHRRGILGQGVGIAIVDTGIAPHPDLTARENRIAGFYDSSDRDSSYFPYDDNGHGTHVSGIAAGDGYSSGGAYRGLAPKSHLVGVRILNRTGNGRLDDILPALAWILDHRYEYDIRIVNISIGCSSPECILDAEDSNLVQAVNELWDAGLIVVAAAGNEGPNPMTITAPGISRKIITVGASDDQLEEYYLSGRKRNLLFSGCGPTTSCILKPDIVAPGNHIVSCRLTGGYTSKSGTSMATPMVSGAIALLLSRYPNLSNLEVKIRLKNSSIDLGFPHERQGWGLLNVKRLVFPSFC